MYSILVLPILFCAGMSLFDSIDGSFMNFAYGWAFAQPVRKIYYNMVITGLSVAVALLIGSQESSRSSPTNSTSTTGFSAQSGTWISARWASSSSDSSSPLG